LNIPGLTNIICYKESPAVGSGRFLFYKALGRCLFLRTIFYMKCFTCILFAFIAASCNEPGKKIPVKEKFDALEKVLETANWEVTPEVRVTDSSAKVDTTYMYFSRMGDTKFNVYHYKMIKGDSVISKFETIEASGDSVLWHADGNRLAVTDINDTGFVINEPAGSQPSRYFFARKDSGHITVSDSSMPFFSMKKTLPLAVFLVRKKYDHIHGTSYAHSSEILPRGMH
jgi:hypothetical protein